MRELFKASVKTGGGSAIGMITEIISTKIMAVILGPTGVGVLSIIRQAHETCKIAASFNGQTALVQGIASHPDADGKGRYIATASWFFLFGIVLVTGLLVVFAPVVSEWISGRSDSEAISLVRWLALPVAITAILTFFAGILNGYKSIGRLSLLYIISGVVTAILAYPVARLVDAGYTLAFIGMLSIAQLCALAYGSWFAYKEGWLKPLLGKIQFSRSDACHFLKFAGTTLAVGLVASGALLAIRALIIRHGDFADAGIFAAAWSLSISYVMVVLSALGTYYLPTLSGMQNNQDRAEMIGKTLRFTALAMLPVVTCVVVLKPFVVEVLLSEEFLPALEIIRWMLIGDFIKGLAWVLGMPMRSFADLRAIWWSEFFARVGLFGCAAIALLIFNSVEGIGVGFVLVNAIYFLYCLHYTKSRFGFRLNRKLFTLAFGGLLLIIGVSWATWSDNYVSWLFAVAAIVIAGGFSWFSLSRHERNQLLQGINSRMKRKL